jgi:hypothetical protein
LEHHRSRASSAEASVTSLTQTLTERDEQQRSVKAVVARLEEEAVTAAARRKQYRRTIELQKDKITLLGNALNTAKAVAMRKVSAYRAQYDSFRNEVLTTINRYLRRAPPLLCASSYSSPFRAPPHSFNQSNRERVAADVAVFTQLITNQQQTIKQLQARLARSDEAQSGTSKQWQAQVAQAQAQAQALAAQIDSYKRVVGEQDENIAFKTRELELTKKKASVEGQDLFGV